MQYGAAFCDVLAASGAVAPLPPTSTGASLTMIAERQPPVNSSCLTAKRPKRWKAPASKRSCGALRSTTAMPESLSRHGSARTARRLPKSRSPPNSRSTSSIVRHDRRAQGNCPRRLRWGQFKRLVYKNAVMVVSTPLYSNTTLVAYLPTLAHGSTAVLLPKFDAGQFLRISQERRATHAMLVPVQYRAHHGARGFRAIRSLELRA